MQDRSGALAAIVPLQAVMALVLFIGIGACTSITGPSPVVNVTKFKAANDAYLNGDVVGPFNSSDATKRGGLTAIQWRNAVIGAQLDSADQNYAAYAKALRSERTSFSLVADLTVLGLAGGGAVAAKTTANALSAASAGIVGANSALNKDVYYSATVEALISQMDAGRATVRAQIEQALQKDEQIYPLGRALGDVRRYEAAGTMDRAITQISAAANAAKTAAEANLDLARSAQFVAAEEVAARLAARVAKLTDVQALTVFNALKPKLSERSATVQQNIKAIAPNFDNTSDGGTAKKILQSWAPIDDRTAALQKEWADAIDAATQ